MDSLRYLGCFLACLTLAQEEELVVTATAVKDSTTGKFFGTTDANTVGQQLDRLDVILDKGNDTVFGIELVGTIIGKESRGFLAFIVE